MSGDEKENSVFRALSTTGGYIAVALMLVTVAVMASFFDVSWSQRIATLWKRKTSA